MALIKLGGLAQDVRGTLNGSVFSRNRGGAFIRSKVSPVQPVSSFSSAARAMFGALSQSWSTNLSDVDRAAWEAFAAVHPFVNVFGDAIILSGVAFYQSVNRRLLQMGEPEITTPPATFDVPDIISVTASAETDGVGNLTFNVQIGRALDADEVLYIFSSTPILGARAVQKNDYRLVNNTINGGYASPSDIGPDYLTRFPSVSILDGSKIALLVQAVNTVTGAASSPVSTTLKATALPGPLIQLVEFQLISDGGGNVHPFLVTAVPHGLSAGQTVTVALDPANATVDGAGQVIASADATTLQLGTRVGAATGIGPTGGTVQRTA